MSYLIYDKVLYKYKFAFISSQSIFDCVNWKKSVSVDNRSTVYEGRLSRDQYAKVIKIQCLLFTLMMTDIIQSIDSLTDKGCMSRVGGAPPRILYFNLLTTGQSTLFSWFNTLEGQIVQQSITIRRWPANCGKDTANRFKLHCQLCITPKQLMGIKMLLKWTINFSIKPIIKGAIYDRFAPCPQLTLEAHFTRAWTCQISSASDNKHLNDNALQTFMWAEGRWLLPQHRHRNEFTIRIDVYPKTGRSFIVIERNVAWKQARWPIESVFCVNGHLH